MYVTQFRRSTCIPPNLQVTAVIRICADIQLLIIDVSWEEPASLINNSITNYTVRLNVSFGNEISEHLFLEYENMTTEPSIVYNISQDGIHSIVSVVTVDVLAQNKVGIGEAVRKIVLPNINEELRTSSFVVASSSVTPPLYPESKAVSPTANTNNRMLIYGKYRSIIL